MPTVRIPGLGDVDFPDTMPQSEIDNHAMRLYRENLMSQQGEIRAAPSALKGFGQRVLQESGLPASTAAVEKLPDQSFFKNLLMPLGMINVPFQAIGEAAQAGAEKLGATPPDPTNTLSQLLAPRTLATLGTSYAIPAAIQAVRNVPNMLERTLGDIIPSLGRVGPTAAPSSLAVQAKRAYEAAPTVLPEPEVPSGMLPPPEQLRAAAAMQTRQPGVAPTQMNVAENRAGMRGPALLSETGRPLITDAPERTGRGTSEIVDEFGRRIPTRPPQHIEPADQFLPPTVSGPVGFGEKAPGTISTAAQVAAGRAGLKLPSAKPNVTPEFMDEWNTTMRQGGFVTPAVAARVGGAAVGGAGGAYGGAELGETPEEKVKLGIVGGIVGAGLGAAAPGALSRWNQRVGKQIEWAERADLDVLSPGPLLRRPETLKAAQGLKSTLSPSRLASTVSAINDTLQTSEAAVGRMPGATQRSMPVHVPLTLRLVQAMESDPSVVSKLGANVNARGGTLMDVAQLMVDSAQNPAQLFTRWKALSRVLEQDALSNPQAAKLLRSIIDERPGLSLWDKAGHFARRADNAWRGLLVSALRTGERNFGLQQGRVGIEALESMVEGAVAKAVGVGTPADRSLTSGARYAWEYTLGWASPNARRQINDVLSSFPAYRDKLLQLYSSDVVKQLHSLGPGLARTKGGELRPMGAVSSQADRVFEGIDYGVHAVNFLNRFQEVMTRKAAMRAKLLELLEKRGIHDLDNIPVNQIPVEDIARSVQHALKVTFAESPSRLAPGPIERMFAAVLENTGSKARWAIPTHVVLGMPFVRYMFNAGRFIAEHPYTMTVPAMRTLWRMTSAAERAKMTRGDLTTISKTVTGWTGLLAAWQFVNSEYAGDGILEAKTPFGNVNLSVLGPLVPAYVLPARMIKEMQDGNLKARWPEFVKAAMEMRNRVEGVILGVDNLIQSIPELGDEATDELTATDDQTWLQRRLEELDKPTRSVRKFAGETAAGSMQFLTSLQRLFAAYGQHIPGLEAVAEEENTKRDTRSDPFTGPLRARVPVVARQVGLPTAADLPPQTSALRAGPIQIETPLQLGGVPLPADLIGFQAAPQRTTAETEALTLGLKPREIAGQPSSFPGADRLVRRTTGRIADPIMSRVLESSKYSEMTPALRTAVFTKIMEEIRGEARTALRDKIAEKLQGGQGLTDEEREFFDMTIKAAIDPRWRDVLRERGKNLPR